MTFAAWFELYDDDVIVSHPAALRVYAKLLRNRRIFFEPQWVRAWSVAEELGLNRRTVAAALDLLVCRGYLVDHGRAPDNVRLITVTMVRSTQVGTEN